mgnify:CR=1 FL=1
MTFTYPAVFTPHKDDKGFHAYFPDLEDAVENAREAARDWITVELEDACDIPPSSHVDDIELEEGSFVKFIMVTIKLLPDND